MHYNWSIKVALQYWYGQVILNCSSYASTSHTCTFLCQIPGFYSWTCRVCHSVACLYRPYIGEVVLKAIVCLSEKYRGSTGVISSETIHNFIVHTKEMCLIFTWGHLACLSPVRSDIRAADASAVGDLMSRHPPLQTCYTSFCTRWLKEMSCVSVVTALLGADVWQDTALSFSSVLGNLR